MSGRFLEKTLELRERRLRVAGFAGQQRVVETGAEVARLQGERARVRSQRLLGPADLQVNIRDGEMRFFPLGPLLAHRQQLAQRFAVACGLAQDPAQAQPHFEVVRFEFEQPAQERARALELALVAKDQRSVRQCLAVLGIGRQAALEMRRGPRPLAIARAAGRRARYGHARSRDTPPAAFRSAGALRRRRPRRAPGARASRAPRPRPETALPCAAYSRLAPSMSPARFSSAARLR